MLDILNLTKKRLSPRNSSKKLIQINIFYGYLEKLREYHFLLKTKTFV